MEPAATVALYALAALVMLVVVSGLCMLTSNRLLAHGA
jgi:hypothetical protein